MIGKGFSGFLDRTALFAFTAFSALAALTAFALTLRAQTTQGTPTPSATPSPPPKSNVSPAPKPYATSYGKPFASPSASPSPSVQLPPDLLPENKPAPIPTPPPPASNDLLPENKPAPTPVEQPAPGAQDLLPSTPTPGPSAAVSAPEQAEPTPTPKKLAEQLLKEKMRFRQLESIAERDPHAVELWDTANRQSTMEYRRRWQRLYYVHVCDIMRKLDPSISELIDAWEQTHLSAQSLHNTRPTIPNQELQGPLGEQQR
jgi:hypothetical protein